MPEFMTRLHIIFLFHCTTVSLLYRNLLQSAKEQISNLQRFLSLTAITSMGMFHRVVLHCGSSEKISGGEEGLSALDQKKK